MKKAFRLFLSLFFIFYFSSYASPSVLEEEEHQRTSRNWSKELRYFGLGMLTLGAASMIDDDLTQNSIYILALYFLTNSVMTMAGYCKDYCKEWWYGEPTSNLMANPPVPQPKLSLQDEEIIDLNMLFYPETLNPEETTSSTKQKKPDADVMASPPAPQPKPSAEEREPDLQEEKEEQQAPQDQAPPFQEPMQTQMLPRPLNAPLYPNREPEPLNKEEARQAPQDHALPLQEPAPRIMHDLSSDDCSAQEVGSHDVLLPQLKDLSLQEREWMLQNNREILATQRGSPSHESMKKSPSSLKDPAYDQRETLSSGQGLVVYPLNFHEETLPHSPQQKKSAYEILHFMQLPPHLIHKLSFLYTTQLHLRDQAERRAFTLLNISHKEPHSRATKLRVIKATFISKRPLLQDIMPTDATFAYLLFLFSLNIWGYKNFFRKRNYVSSRRMNPLRQGANLNAPIAAQKSV